MKFVLPSIAYKEKAIDLINEFISYQSDIHTNGSLHRVLKQPSYEKWLEKLKNDIDIANIARRKVSALT